MDTDFIAEAIRRLRVGEPFATVIYVSQAKAVIARCIDDLALLAESTESAEAMGQVVYLPL